MTTDTPSSEPNPARSVTLRSESRLFREADVLVAVRNLEDEGTRAWPSIRVSFDALLGCVHRHVEAHGDSVKLSPELYLAAACVAGDSAAISILEADYLAKVPMFVGRIVAARKVSSLPDFMRGLRECLLVTRGGRLPRLFEYSGRGLLASWLRVVAVRLAIEG